MNSIHFEQYPRCEYPAIELDMTDFIEHLSEEYIGAKVDVRNEDVQTNPKIIDSQTKNCTDLGDISCISKSRLQREEEVRKFNVTGVQV